MEQFDKSTFEGMMRESVELLHEGNFKDALDANITAYNIAPDNSSEKGRAARDAAARYDRLGNTSEAQIWATEGFAIHNDIVEADDSPTREAYRERAASALFVGVVGLRSAIHARQSGKAVEDTGFLAYLRSTLADLKAANAQAEGINQQVDQYQINAVRRVSMAESLFGKRKSGGMLGLQAVALAFMSESPKLDTANPTLTLRERLSIKKRGILGGIAALGVAVLASSHNDTAEKFALRVADKTL